MPGLCRWETDAGGCSICYLWCVWHSSDLVERAIFISFGLMLAYTFFVLVRFFRRCLLAHFESRELRPEAAVDFLQRKRALVAQLSRGLGTLKAIGSAAPFLGLAGTTYLILDSLFRGFSASRSSALYYLTNGTASSLISAAAGIIVAVPAVVIHNFLRIRVESMRREVSVGTAPPGPIDRPFRRAQTLRLRRRFACVPPFAVIAISALVCALGPFIAAPSDIATGLRVHLLRIGAADGDRRSGKPIVIAMVATSNDDYVLRLNSKETSLDHLEEALADQLRLTPEKRVYVEADRTLAWGSVARVIDTARGLRCEVFLFTTTPESETNSKRSRGAKIPVAGVPRLR